MKYTNYILNGHPVQPETIIADKGMMRIVTTVTVIPVTIVGMVVLGGLLPAAALMDSGRYVKLKYLLYQREQRRLNYIRCVLRSLDREPNNQLISLLKAA